MPWHPHPVALVVIVCPEAPYLDHVASCKILPFQVVLIGVLGPALSLPVLVGPLALGQGPERPIEALDVHGPGIVGLVILLAHMVGLREVSATNHIHLLMSVPHDITS